jgi:hypothetical protein
MKQINRFTGITCLLVLSLACGKKAFLDAKPDRSLAELQTIQEFQALMDNDGNMNGATTVGLTPQLGEIAADNYFVSDADFNTRFRSMYQNAYSWSHDLYSAGDAVYDWDFPYRSVLSANIALEGLSRLDRAAAPAAWDNVRGSALFYRGHIFYHLAQVFAPPFDSATAETAWGIPLRATSSVAEKTERAHLGPTYRTILAELAEAATLLPETGLYKTRPSRVAVWGLLARIHLSLRHYDSAGYYAGKYLAVQNSLLDFNTLSASGLFAFPRFNTEVTFHCNGANGDDNPLRPGRNQPDTFLYRSYAVNDLRRTLYFKVNSGVLTFTGSYDGSASLFTGIATDEIYLTRAESRARLGDVAGAMQDLNTLLQKRWKTGTFVPLSATTPADALAKVLAERRKELCFRGLRWTDLRRLNQEGYSISLSRKVNGVVVTLPPNDVRYTYPIPLGVIGFNPGMPQNPR